MEAKIPGLMRLDLFGFYLGLGMGSYHKFIKHFLIAFIDAFINHVNYPIEVDLYHVCTIPTSR